MIKAATHAEYMNCGSFCSLVCAEWGYPFHGLSQSDAESVFFAPKPYADTASRQKTLKRAKSGKQKAATYAQKRELRFSFCSLVCAECGSPYFAGTVCQMFFAYSFTALSAANLPEQAVFISDIEFQRVLSAQSSSILFCAWR
jgi:hypothetical protein